MSQKTCFIVTAIGANGSPERSHADKVLTYLIQPVCQELGYNVIRVDQETSTGNINESIINHLKNDDLVIADMTGHNANAFFELGYRQALGLPLVPIIKEGERLPFDVIAERTVFYDTDVSQIEQSKQRLKDMISDFKDFMMPAKRQKTVSEFDKLHAKLDKLIQKVEEQNRPITSLLTTETLRSTINPELIATSLIQPKNPTDKTT